MKKTIKNILTFVVLGIALFPYQVFAGTLQTAPNQLDKVIGKTGIDKTQSVQSITGTVINTALSMVGIIFLVLMVYAGYLWMTARGEESQVEKAKKIVYSSMIGLGLTLGAYAITVLITSRFSK
ncbi:MAG: hypothetical protein V1848_00935 [Candidatus Magasanikbacteria bacterium]